MTCARLFALRSASALLAIAMALFWQFAAWKARIDTKLENERASE